MKRFKFNLHFIISALCVLIFSLDTRAESNSSLRCFVDADRHCNVPNGNLALGNISTWVRLSDRKRDELYFTKDVQDSAQGCVNYAKLIKTECLIPTPITTVFYQDKAAGKMQVNIVTSFFPKLNEDISLSGMFRAYFLNCDQNGNIAKHFEYGKCVDNGTHLPSAAIIENTTSPNPAPVVDVTPVSDYQSCRTDQSIPPNSLESAIVYSKENGFNGPCQATKCIKPFTLVKDTDGVISCRLHCKYDFSGYGMSQYLCPAVNGIPEKDIVPLIYFQNGMVAYNYGGGIYLRATNLKDTEGFNLAEVKNHGGFDIKRKYLIANKKALEEVEKEFVKLTPYEYPKTMAIEAQMPNVPVDNGKIRITWRNLNPDYPKSWTYTYSVDIKLKSGEIIAPCTGPLDIYHDERNWLDFDGTCFRKRDALGNPRKININDIDSAKVYTASSAVTNGKQWNDWDSAPHTDFWMPINKPIHIRIPGSEPDLKKMRKLTIEKNYANAEENDLTKEPFVNCEHPDVKTDICFIPEGTPVSLGLSPTFGNKLMPTEVSGCKINVIFDEVTKTHKGTCDLYMLGDQTVRAK